jgi:hypothetical protein
MGDPVDLAVPPASTGNYAGARWILGEAESYARRAAPGVKAIAELFVAGAAPTLLSQAQNAEVVSAPHSSWLVRMAATASPACCSDR